MHFDSNAGRRGGDGKLGNFSSKACGGGSTGSKSLIGIVLWYCSFTDGRGYVFILVRAISAKDSVNSERKSSALAYMSTLGHFKNLLGAMLHKSA